MKKKGPVIFIFAVVAIAAAICVWVFSQDDSTARKTETADSTADTQAYTIDTQAVTTDDTTDSNTDTTDTATDSQTETTEATTTEDKQTLFYAEEVPTDLPENAGVENAQITTADLTLLHLLYIDFNGEEQTGEIICNNYIAQDLLEIFYELYTAGYQIERMELMDCSNYDDELSMEANNTSCFCYRNIEGTGYLSNHALGLAVDINPLYNPEVTTANGTQTTAPQTATDYADRSADFPHKIDENDLAYKLFTAHGFTWGGNWATPKDYMHFEKQLRP